MDLCQICVIIERVVVQEKKKMQTWHFWNLSENNDNDYSMENTDWWVFEKD